MSRSQDSPKTHDLGDLELAVLEVLWGRSWTTVREVHEALTVERALAYTTVMTVMVRLERRGVLMRRREGRAFLYQTAVSRREVSRSFLSRVKQRLFRGRAGLLVHQLIEDEAIGLEELEAIRALIDQRTEGAKQATAPRGGEETPPRAGRGAVPGGEDLGRGGDGGGGGR